jgi:SAM-dependent methyltransferase
MLPRRDWPEITDLLVAFDPDTLARRRVHRAEVVRRLERIGDARGARIVARLPADAEGFLDETAVDARILRVHREMQLLAEEFFHGLRMRQILEPVIRTVRGATGDRPIRALDIGCGHGYVLRWLAAHADLGDDVELVGADLNPALIDEARRLARLENLRCRFEVADAARLPYPTAVQFSTGILHHFRGDELEALFAGHEREGVQAFLHFDFQPSPLAPLGSWFFHRVRMRDPLTRHDGHLSAIRAHPAERLLQAVGSAAPGFDVCMFSTHLKPLPLPRVFHVLIGVRPESRAALETNLGRLRARLGSWR